MNLKEVVALLEQIVEEYPSFDGFDFVIGTSKAEVTIVEHYTIHITGPFDDEKHEYLGKLVIKKKLAIHQEPNSVMIYRAKPL